MKKWTVSKAIILILAVILFPLPVRSVPKVVESKNGSSASEATEEERQCAEGIKELTTSLIRYKVRGGIYPTQKQGLMALVLKPTVPPFPARHRALVKPAALIDPYGRPFQYLIPGKKNKDSYDIFSLGKDGKEGTEDDVGNWE